MKFRVPSTSVLPPCELQVHAMGLCSLLGSGHLTSGPYNGWSTSAEPSPKPMPCFSITEGYLTHHKVYELYLHYISWQLFLVYWFMFISLVLLYCFTHKHKWYQFLKGICFLKVYFFMCMSCLCVCLCATCVPGATSVGTAVTDHCEPPRVCWELDLGPLKTRQSS